MKQRMSGVQRASLYAAGAVLLLSGLLWLVVHYLNGSADAAGASYSLEPFALRIHGAAAMAMLVIIGTLIPTHLADGWSSGDNMPTGLGMLAVTTLLTVTGWGLYYAGDEALRSMLSIAHWVLGIAALPLLFVHRSRRRAARE